MAGSLKDFEDFLNQTYAIMLNYCKAHRQKHEDADEIVNDAFGRMWCAWDICGFLDPIKRKKWLYNTIDNIILERNRKHVPQINDIDEYIDELQDEVGDELIKAFEDLKFEIYVNRIRKLLSIGEWELFDQIIIKQRSYKEAAKELGRSVTVAYVQMARIRKKNESLKDEIFR